MWPTWNSWIIVAVHIYRTHHGSWTIWKTGKCSFSLRKAYVWWWHHCLRRQQQEFHSICARICFQLHVDDFFFAGFFFFWHPSPFVRQCKVGTWKISESWQVHEKYKSTQESKTPGIWSTHLDTIIFIHRQATVEPEVNY